MAQPRNDFVLSDNAQDHLDWTNQIGTRAQAYFDVVADYGAVGDGVTDDTTAIQAAIDAAEASGGQVIFPRATYVMGQVTVGTSDGVTLDGTGAAVLDLTGSNAGFWMSGTVSNLTVKGFKAEGDGTSTNGQSLVRNASGQTLSNIKVLNNVISNIQLGVSITSESGGSIEHVEVAHNHISTLQGTTGGTGYGIHVAGANNTPIYANIHDNHIIDSSRHAIYVARGDDVIVADNLIQDHRSTDAESLVRSAIQMSRGSRRIVTGNVLENCSDGMIGVLPDATALTEDVLVEGNMLGPGANNIPQMWIGDSSPSTAGDISRITIQNNVFTPGTTCGTGISLNSGTEIDILDNLLVVENTTGQAIAFEAENETAGTTTYSDDWRIEGNRIKVEGASARAFRSNPTFVTSGVTVRFKHNHITDGTAFSQSAALDGPTVEIVDTPTDGIVWTGTQRHVENGGAYTDSNRPSASSVAAGFTIYNTDDDNLNVSDGTNWRLVSDGIVT